MTTFTSNQRLELPSGRRVRVKILLMDEASGELAFIVVGAALEEPLTGKLDVCDVYDLQPVPNPKPRYLLFDDSGPS